MSAVNPEVHLHVSDLRRSASFYARALGFTFAGYTTEDGAVVSELNAEGDFTSATLLAPDLLVNLLPAALTGANPGAVPDHVVSVPDVDAVHAAVKASGPEPSEVVNQPWGRREFSLVDEDGYPWTLYTPITQSPEQTVARQRGEITGYVSVEDYQRAALEQGLTLQQYLDKTWGTKKATLTDFSEGVFNEVAKFGVFAQPLRRVVEIGTGVGMHISTVKRRCRPESYESYEPERGWADWLAKEYGVISHDCDGVSLRQTATASVDLVHAHGVFVALLFLTSVQYFREMGRILRPGGYAVFDILSEACMNETAIDTWLASEWRWPVVLNKEFVKGFFHRYGFTFVGDFLIATTDEEGKCPANYLIFRKR